MRYPARVVRVTGLWLAVMAASPAAPAEVKAWEGTLTLPSLLLLEDDSSARNPVRRLFAARRLREQRLEEALAAIRQSDVIPRARKRAEEFATTARAALAPLPDTAARSALTDLVEYVLERDH